MKKMKRTGIIWILALILLFAFGAPSQAAVSISAKTAAAAVGGKITLKMNGLTGSQKAVWSSSNKAAATVTAGGVVTGVKAGTANITAKVGNASYVCTVTVRNASLSSSSLIRSRGTTYALKLNGIAATDKVTWKTSNAKIATVTSKGVVKAVAAGSAKITATFGGRVFTCPIAVRAPKLSASSMVLDKGASKTLTLNGVGAKDIVTWKTSNAKVAAVSKKGVVKGIAAGTANITATTGGAVFTCKVTVRVLSLSASAVTLETGSTYTLTVKGKTASETVTFSSGAASVATVSKAGAIKGVKAGTAKITAKVAGKTFTCTVTVKNPVKMNVSAVTVRTGNTYTLKVTGLTSGQTVTWKSSASSIATVTSKGVVKGVKAGTAKVTATAAGKTMTCSVTVKKTETVTTPVAGSNRGGTVIVTTPVINDGKVPASLASVRSQDEKNALSKILYAYNTTYKYYTGYPYTNAHYYGWYGGIYRGGYGCAAFCFEMSDAAFGTNLAKLATDMSSSTIKRTAKVGDIIRLDYNTHSVIIVAFEDTGVVVAEANYNKAVKWGRRITYDEIARTGTNIITRYTVSTPAQIKAAAKMRARLPVLMGNGTGILGG